MDRAPKLKTKPLNAMQHTFLLLYIKNQCKNIEDCAIQAGYSPTSAKKTGIEILKKPEAQAIVDELFTKIVVRKHGLSAENVLNEIGLLASADMADYWDVDDQGYWKRPKDPTAMGKASKCIKKIKFKVDVIKGPEGEEVGMHREIEFELYSKLDALEMLAKHFRVITGGVPANEQQTQGSELLPRIYLPDNGHTGKAVIAVEWENK